MSKTVGLVGRIRDCHGVRQEVFATGFEGSVDASIYVELLLSFGQRLSLLKISVRKKRQVSLFVYA